MKPLVFPAFRSDGKAVRLVELLAVIPQNDLVWSILEFDGLGDAPCGLSMEDFEGLVREKAGGFMVSWNELKLLSCGFLQEINCMVVGAKAETDILSTTEDDFSFCEVVLNLFDSTEWSVWARDTDVMKRFAVFYC